MTPATGEKKSKFQKCRENKEQQVAAIQEENAALAARLEQTRENSRKSSRKSYQKHKAIAALPPSERGVAKARMALDKAEKQSQSQSQVFDPNAVMVHVNDFGKHVADKLGDFGKEHGSATGETMRGFGSSFGTSMAQELRGFGTEYGNGMTRLGSAMAQESRGFATEYGNAAMQGVVNQHPSGAQSAVNHNTNQQATEADDMIMERTSRKAFASANVTRKQAPPQASSDLAPSMATMDSRIPKKRKRDDEDSTASSLLGNLALPPPMKPAPRFAHAARYSPQRAPTKPSELPKLTQRAGDKTVRGASLHHHEAEYPLALPPESSRFDGDQAKKRVIVHGSVRSAHAARKLASGPSASSGRGASLYHHDEAECPPALPPEWSHFAGSRSVRSAHVARKKLASGPSASSMAMTNGGSVGDASEAKDSSFVPVVKTTSGILYDSSSSPLVRASGCGIRKLQFGEQNLVHTPGKSEPDVVGIKKHDGKKKNAEVPPAMTLEQQLDPVTDVEEAKSIAIQERNVLQKRLYSTMVHKNNINEERKRFKEDRMLYFGLCALSLLVILHKSSHMQDSEPDEPDENDDETTEQRLRRQRDEEKAANRQLQEKYKMLKKKYVGVRAERDKYRKQCQEKDR